jgi:hypothetical protein
MNLVIAKAWSENLRSGKFTQGYGNLLNAKNQYCSLGVLCETIKPSTLWHYDADEKRYYFGGEAAAYPPHDITKKAELSTESLTLLSQLNDKYKLSFNEMADYIDRHADRL